MLKRFKNVKGLTNLIGTENILINIHGKVKDTEGIDIPITIDEEGYECVYINAWDGERNYRLLDLLAIQFKCYDLPIQLLKEVSSFPVDGNKINRHLSNIGYRFKCGKLEVPGHPGFFYIPGFIKSAINEELKILYIPTGEYKKWYISVPVTKNNKNIKGGYRSTIIPTLDIRRGSIGRHRAILLAMGEYPDNVDSLVINHKNGIPGDDRRDNLEWVTHSENIIHAYETGLRSQNMPVLSRNVFTGEIIEYRSISDCAFRNGLLNDESMRHRLYSSGFCKVFDNGLQFKFKDDARMWREPLLEEIEGLGREKGISVEVMDCNTGDIKRFISICLAAEYSGINKNFIQRSMLSGIKPLHKGFYIRIKSNSPWPIITKTDISNSFSNTQKKILVKNLRTDEVTEFDNTIKVTEYLKSSGFLDGLKKKGWSLSGTESLVKYKLGVEWPDLGNIDDVLYRRQVGIMARCESTGKVHLAENGVNLAAMLGLNPKSVNRTADTRGSVVHKGYRIRRGINSNPWPNSNDIQRDW